jgi:hypothetical protein
VVRQAADGEDWVQIWRAVYIYLTSGSATVDGPSARRVDEGTKSRETSVLQNDKQGVGRICWNGERILSTGVKTIQITLVIVLPS